MGKVAGDAQLQPNLLIFFLTTELLQILHLMFYLLTNVLTFSFVLVESFSKFKFCWQYLTEKIILCDAYECTFIFNDFTLFSVSKDSTFSTMRTCSSSMKLESFYLKFIGGVNTKHKEFSVALARSATLCLLGLF